MSTVYSAASLPLAVLPITALQVLRISGRDIIFAGIGCRVNVIDAKTHTSLCFQKVLEYHAVHGVVPLASLGNEPENESGQVRLDLIVFGGRQVTWVYLNLTILEEAVRCLSLEIVDTVLAKDWILSCKSSDSCRFQAAFVTSYNALYRLQANTSSNQLECQLLTDGIGIFLYSANLTQRCENSYLIASGTVFGQVLTWICQYQGSRQTWDVCPLVQFNGHRGSIFGVEISQPHVLRGKELRNILSCSDDRMICVWNLPGADDQVLERDSTKPGKFQQCDQTLVRTYGHLSRIWSVSFSDFQQDEDVHPLIVSVGEDGQVQSWSMYDYNATDEHISKIETRYVDRHHAGKNVWAQCHSTWDGVLTFISGGADGQIVSRRYSRDGRADLYSQQSMHSFRNIKESLPSHVLTRNGSLALKAYIATESYLLATTDTGSLLRGSLAAETQEWDIIAQDSGFLTLVASLTVVSEHVFFIRISDQTLCTVNYHNSKTIEICSVRSSKIASLWTLPYSHASTTQDCKVCAAVSYHGRNAIEIHWIEIIEDKAEICGKSSVILPISFEVTSIFYDHDSHILLCGSRAGALALSTGISSATIDAEFSLCKRRVHGQDTVTSICKLESQSQEQQAFYLTTGRDGTYCVHKLTFDEAQEPSLTIVHQITPPIGPNIEGAHIINRPNGTQSLLLHGFHSKNFVVWDETSQTQVMNVDCGGAHRSWMFKPDHLNGQGGTFVWTKAGTLMSYQQKTLDHEIIQTGGHGREIKALATHQLDGSKWLLATGSEDTDIRLFEYCSSPANMSRVQNTTVLKRHTTGLQDLCFSSDGKILISAAGMEELYAWCLSPVPIIGQGVVFACALPNSNHQSDARIMSIDTRVRSSAREDQTLSYTVVAAFSNGRLKILQLDSSADPAEMHFIPLHILDFGTICLTQVRLCSGPSSRRQSKDAALVGATNGSVRMCDVSDTSPFLNSLVVSSSEDSNAVTLPFHLNLHQNSITSLQALHLDSKHQILVTGGDDSALVITLITSTDNIVPATTHSSSSPALLPQPAEYAYRSLIIPTAHAAALTALQLLNVTQVDQTSLPDKDKQDFHIVTAGNDQRIQLWSLTVDMAMFLHEQITHGSNNSRLMDEMQIDWLGEWYTDVADISAMDILRGTAGEGVTDFIDVLVVGVGMEVLRLDLKMSE